MTSKYIDIKPIECPICCKQSKLYASYCTHQHWVCIDCIEKISCHLIYDISYTFINAFLDADYKRSMRCPLCREGCFNLNPQEIFGILYLNLDISSLKTRIHFRGQTYYTQGDAILDWTTKPQYTIECAHCSRPSYFVRQEDSLEAYLDNMRKTCTRCDDCGLVLPLEDLRKHVLAIHYPHIDTRKFGPRWSRRIDERKRKLDTLRQNGTTH